MIIAFVAISAPKREQRVRGLPLIPCVLVKLYRLFKHRNRFVEIALLLIQRSERHQGSRFAAARWWSPGSSAQPPQAATRLIIARVTLCFVVSNDVHGSRRMRLRRSGMLRTLK